MKTNDALVTQVTNAKIAAFIALDKSFTAFDITQAVRSELGTGILVDHNDVKSLVHSAFLNKSVSGIDGYKRELDYNTGAPVAPYRYSKEVTISQSPVQTVATQTNKPASNNSTNPILSALYGGTSTPQAASNPSSQAAQAAQTAKVVSRQGEKLRLLKDVLGKAGFRSGQEVHATYLPSTKTIFVTSQKPRGTSDPMAVTKNYTVDVKENIRINLSALGANANQSFVAVPQNGQITIQCG